MSKFKITYKHYDVELSLRERVVEGSRFKVRDGVLAVEKTLDKVAVLFAAGEWVSIEPV